MYSKYFLSVNICKSLLSTELEMLNSFHFVDCDIVSGALQESNHTRENNSSGQVTNKCRVKLSSA